MELIPQFKRLFDLIIEAELYGRKISCADKCSACCRQLVPLSIPEAFYLKRVLVSLPEKRRKRISDKFSESMAILEKAGLFRSQANHAENFDLQSDYFSLGLKCPFLESGSCGIYEDRPFVCREYHVDSDSRLCADPFHQEIVKIKINRNPGALFAAFTFRLYGLPPAPVPLVLLTDWIKHYQYLELAKWPGTFLVEKFFNGLKQLNDQEIEISLENC